MDLESRFRFLLDGPVTTPEEWEVARAIAREMARDLGVPLRSDLPVPTWLVLSALAEISPVMFHGTSEPNIEAFAPRQCVDSNPFGAQLAVYGTRDPLWAMFYAVLDRNPKFSLHNGCFRIFDEEGNPSEPKYFFSIAAPALMRHAFSPGFIYLLPGETFSQEPRSNLLGKTIEVDHWASLEPVRPLSRIAVSPSDFPFLNQVRGHRDEVLWDRIKNEPDGFPLVDELYS